MDMKICLFPDLLADDEEARAHANGGRTLQKGAFLRRPLLGTPLLRTLLRTIPPSKIHWTTSSKDPS